MSTPQRAQPQSNPLPRKTNQIRGVSHDHDHSDLIQGYLINLISVRVGVDGHQRRHQVSERRSVSLWSKSCFHLVPIVSPGDTSLVTDASLVTLIPRDIVTSDQSRRPHFRPITNALTLKPCTWCNKVLPVPGKNRRDWIVCGASNQLSHRIFDCRVCLRISQ